MLDWRFFIQSQHQFRCNQDEPYKNGNWTQSPHEIIIIIRRRQNLTTHQFSR